MLRYSAKLPPQERKVSGSRDKKVDSLRRACALAFQAGGRAILCFVANAWMLLIPGMTSYSKVTVPLAMTRSMILSALSVKRRIAPH
jgi:hypothetical protein